MTDRRYLLFVAAISLAGLWLRAPLLHTGFIVDDYAQLSMMAGTYPVQRSPLALFTFTSGDLAENQTLKDAGFLPWWTHPALKISLFRPLASALMWFDYATFGDDAWLFHVHSAVWWLCMSITWGLLVRHFVPSTWALIVFTLCTAHPANEMLLHWIANRNASMAMFFGLLSLLLQVRRREDGALVRSSESWLIPACWVLCLCSGEYGAGILVFSLMFEITSCEPARTKWILLRPCIAVVIAYVLVRVGFGFSSRESGMYIDPTGEPYAFLHASIHRAPVLVADLVLGLRANWWSGGYPWAEAAVRALSLSNEWIADLRPLRAVHEEVGLGAIAIAAWLAWYGQRQNSELRFASLALPLSVISALGGVPESRLLLPAMFGWSLLLAQIIRSLILRLRQERRTATILALVSAVTLFALESKANLEAGAEDRKFLPLVANAAHSSILAPTLDAALRGVEDAFLIAAVDPTTTIYIPMLRRWHHHAGPVRCHLLLSTVASMRLYRVGSDEFRLVREQSFYTPPDAYAEAFRRAPLKVGQTFVMQNMRASVEQVQDGLPTVVHFKTMRNLDDPALVLLSQGVSGIQVSRFPPLGQSMSIAPANFPFALMGTGR